VTGDSRKRHAQCLALVTEAFGGPGGVAQYNRDFLTALAASGCVGSIRVMPRDAPEIAVLPSGLEQEKPRQGRVAYTIGALARGALWPVDVVFCGHIHLAPVAAAIARLRGAKLVMQAHGIEIWQRPSALWRAAIEASDLILCVSRHTRGAVLNAVRVAPERVVVVPNTVREEFTPGDGDGFRRELGLQGKRLLLTVGRLDSRERYKGQDRIIAALPKLAAKGHDIVYLIAGGGDDQRRLEMLAREGGVAERVRFLGALGSDHLVDAYRAADLFVMASTGEGFGISFLEAMACGTPALGLAVAGAHDALADGALGTMVDEGDLCAAIDRLLTSPRPGRQDLAASVQARFGRDLFAANVRAAFARIGFS
jgi:phosphatidylinositol alpha-1,6-mannosyltransferase